MGMALWSCRIKGKYLFVYQWQFWWSTSGFVKYFNNYLLTRDDKESTGSQCSKQLAKSFIIIQSWFPSFWPTDIVKTGAQVKVTQDIIVSWLNFFVTSIPFLPPTHCQFVMLIILRALIICETHTDRHTKFFFMLQSGMVELTLQ